MRGRMLLLGFVWDLLKQDRRHRFAGGVTSRKGQISAADTYPFPDWPLSVQEDSNRWRFFAIS
jgi:hypothetical protein